MTTVYVFGVKRPMDKEPWFLAFENEEQARDYPHRCTMVHSVETVMLPVGEPPGWCGLAHCRNPNPHRVGADCSIGMP